MISPFVWRLLEVTIWKSFSIDVTEYHCKANHSDHTLGVLCLGAHFSLGQAQRQGLKRKSPGAGWVKAYVRLHNSYSASTRVQWAHKSGVCLFSEQKLEIIMLLLFIHTRLLLFNTL